MVYRIGMIIEDQSDLDVLNEIVRKLAGRRQYKIIRFFGFGAGPIQRKCRAWAEILKQKGCTSLILVRDLDTNSLSSLRASLEAALNPSPIATKIVVIPIMEIEAWLLADHNAINTALGLKKQIKKISSPENIQKPKEKLRDLIYLKSEKKKRYVNTAHNIVIAKKLDINNLRRCSSFTPLEDFLNDLFEIHHSSR